MSALLEAVGLSHAYRAGRRTVPVLHAIDLAIAEGRSLGLVGESGCGKSTLARCLLRLVDPTGGRVVYRGRDLLRLSARELRPLRRELQLVFQDPGASFDPRLTLAESLREPLRVHHLEEERSRRRAQLERLIEPVGLRAELLERFPHELSVGQLQRAAVARALALSPRLLVADEPTSALDVSLSAQLLNLLADLRRDRGLTYLFITHQLPLVEAICEEVAVLYFGRIVERLSTSELGRRALHPYTQALLQASPRLPGRTSAGGDLPSPRVRLEGEPASPLAPPPGCSFHPRCPLYRARGAVRCTAESPTLRTIGAEHEVACHEV